VFILLSETSEPVDGYDIISMVQSISAVWLLPYYT